jgi:hypothetical protein
MKPHYNVLIATPGSELSNQYVKSLTNTISELNKRNLSWKWLNESSSLVGNAREMTIGGDRELHIDDTSPLHGKCTYDKIIWIDSDISWKVEHFFKLYDSSFEIMSGTYLLADGKKSTNMSPKYPQGIPKEDVLKMKEIIPVDIAGFGFIAMKSGVFEKIERPWFAYMSNIVLDSKGNRRYLSLGEDISWCMKAKEAGFTIYFDPSILVDHMKTVAVGWN